MAEGARLESVFRGNSNVGSNPTLSAIVYLSLVLALLVACPVFGIADDNIHCHVVSAHEPTAAETAYLAGDAASTESLYREALKKAPHDSELVSGLVRTLLREQKVDDADTTIRLELTAAPNSATESSREVRQKCSPERFVSGTAVLSRFPRLHES